jgi:hypothetical protein
LWYLISVLLGRALRLLAVNKALVLTAFDFNVAQLSVHGEILQVHWTRSRDGKSETLIEMER